MLRRAVPADAGGGWTLARMVERGVAAWREGGVRDLVYKALGETFYRRLVLIERSLDEPVPEVQPGVPVTIDLLTQGQVEAYCRFRPGAEPDEVRQRLTAGHWCFAAWHEGTIVHAGWAASGQAWIEYLGRSLDLAPDELYVYHSYTDPAYRGHNLAPLRIAAMVGFFRQRGYQRLIGAVLPENRVAFRPGEKGGYRQLGLIGTVRIGRWRWGFCRTLPGARPPGQSLAGYGAAYWDQVALRTVGGAGYLDPFLGALKRETHLALIRRWGGVPESGWAVKTDLFEEALGPDAFLLDLAAMGRRVVGMDVSPVIVGRAQGHDSERQARYLAADVRHLPFSSGSLVLVVSPSTLDHFADPTDLTRSLREIHRVLADSGRLIVTLDNRQNVLDPLLRLAVRLGRVPYYVGRSYRASELRAELEAAGFQVREQTAILHNPRLVAVAAVGLANRLGWPPLVWLVRRVLTAAQRLERSRWRYRSGSFVAALAVRARGGGEHKDG